MVIPTNSDEAGFVAEDAIRHYTALAQGGPGLIIQEATCVSPEDRLGLHQIGLWSDEQIEGNRRIAQVVHAKGVPIFMQIHHAGIMSVGGTLLCPSDYALKAENGIKQGRAMTVEEIEVTCQHFIDTGIRAWKAGYDGVELHGCHNYLLCQFFNKRVNTRTDKYADPMALVAPIIEGIRTGTDEDFVIGIRLGCFEPTIEDGIAHAQALEKVGVDFIDVSGGFSAEAETDVPAGLTYHPFVYGAGEIKKAVDLPVFAVNSICTPEDARTVLAGTNVDMVDIARSALVDPDWPKKALGGEAPGKCIHCKVCQWRIDPEKCAGRILMRRRAQ